MSDDDDDYTEHDKAALRYANADTPEKKFNSAADRTFLAGRDMYPGFEAKLDALKEAGVMSGPFVQFLMQSEKPASVINTLGSDVETAAKLAGQNAVQLAHSIAAIERGERIPTYDDHVPAHMKLSNDLSNPDLPNDRFSLLWNRKYLGRDRQ